MFINKKAHLKGFKKIFQEKKDYFCVLPINSLLLKHFKILSKILLCYIKVILFL